MIEPQSSGIAQIERLACIDVSLKARERILIRLHGHLATVKTLRLFGWILKFDFVDNPNTRVWFSGAPVQIAPTLIRLYRLSIESSHRKVPDDLSLSLSHSVRLVSIDV